MERSDIPGVVQAPIEVVAHDVDLIDGVERIFQHRYVDGIDGDDDHLPLHASRCLQPSDQVDVLCRVHILFPIELDAVVAIARDEIHDGREMSGGEAGVH